MNRVYKRPKIKICGITNLDDARYCAAAGADFLGFVQYDGSPRYVDPPTCRQIIEWVAGPKPVGVFVNEDLQTVNEISSEAGFEFVQLHGNEEPELCAQTDLPVIKAFRISSDMTEERLRPMLDRYAGTVQYFLLDTYHPDRHGGTGMTFSWNLAAAIAEDYDIFLAGGITPDNLQKAVHKVRPLGIDVSSGVEASPGHKDFDKLQALFDALPAETE